MKLHNNEIILNGQEREDLGGLPGKIPAVILEDVWLDAMSTAQPKYLQATQELGLIINETTFMPCFGFAALVGAGLAIRFLPHATKVRRLLSMRETVRGISIETSFTDAI